MFVLQVAVMKGRGGVLTSLFHYARMFDAVGVKSLCLYRGPEGDRLRAGGVQVVDAPQSLNSPLFAFTRAFARLRGDVRSQNGGRDPDVALVHSDLALKAVRRLFPSTVVMTPCHSDKFKRKRDADLVVTLNAAQQQLMSEHLPGQRIAQLGNPYVAPPAHAPSEAGSPRLNFVARFIPTKDPETLLRAMPLVKAERPALRYIGAGELEPRLRETAVTLGIAAAFAGWQPAPFSLFHRNDILVLPSRWEGLPYLLQEALDHGAPIIAADNPGNRAALKDGAYGMLFPWGDAVALAACIDSALADLDALRAMAEDGRAALRKTYGAEPFWAALTRELDVLEHA